MRSQRSDAAKTQRALRDISENIRRAERFVADVTFEAFLLDEMRIYAVTRCLEIVSEASRRIDDGLKARHPDVEWMQMAAAGNIYRHEYEGVRPLYLWRTVKQDLHLLLAAIEAEIDAT